MQGRQGDEGTCPAPGRQVSQFLIDLATIISGRIAGGHGLWQINGGVR